MTTTNHLATLVSAAFLNQDMLNRRLDPQWQAQGWHYYRAVWTEAAEIFDHTNWAWWSKATYDKPLSEAQTAEIHIELCDIFHFGISLDLIRWCNESDARTAQVYEAYLHAFEDAKSSTETLEDAVEGLIIDAILMREFNIKKFARACRAVRLSLTGLMAYYFAKTALNQFRWDNGYKLPKDDPKAYVKMWKLPTRAVATEDNTHLIELMDSVVIAEGKNDLPAYIASGEYVTAIKSRLTARYAIIER